MTDADPDLATVRKWVREASQRTVDPVARDLLRDVLAELAPDLGAPIVECPVCHRLMVRERLAAHDC